MIIEKTTAQKSLAVALVLALFAGSPLSAFAQTRTALVNAPVSGVIGVVGSLGAVGVNPSGSIGLAGPLALSGVPLFTAPAIPVRPSVVDAAHALAVVESFPAGAVRQTMASFIGALSDVKHSEGLASQIFDSSRKFAASEEDAVSGVPEAGEGVKAEAIALHKAYEAAAKQRLAVFEQAVEQVKSGRIGLKLPWQIEQGKLTHGVGYTLDGKLLPADRDQTLMAAAISPEQWAAAKAEIDHAVPELVKQLVSVLKLNEREHQAVHRKMDALVQDAALKSAKETLQKGADLQAWGVPVAISVNQKTYMRYARTYRLNGMPTDLGAALHDLLAPFIAADPQFLSKVTAAQLHESAQYLSDSLKYTLDEATPDGMKKIRLSGGREGYDYPEARKSLVDLARKKLTETPLPGDQSAGLVATPETMQPASVLKGIFMALMEKYDELAARGVSDEETGPLVDLLMAMHSAMGIPVQTPKGMTMLPVTHRQLQPILEELVRRNVEAAVVRAVIRSFPLGESLLRLGVDKLWASGNTGKGVKVGVIDNGVDFNHPDMADIENPIFENMTRDRGMHTKGGHGTPMASIIHAIAPDAEIQSYQVLSNVELPGVALSGDEVEAAILQAMDRAVANGAQILSLSLGGPMAYSNDSMAAKISELAKKGIVVIISAGNSGGQLPKGFQVGSPGTSPDAITVGAVDYHGKFAAFSSEGVVFNPSNGTAAEKPDIYAYGVNIKAAMQLPAAMYAQEPVAYNHVSGTSPATPLVVGVAALMLSAAHAAGADIANAAIPGAVRESLMAGVQRIERLPVLSDAAAAVKALVERLRTPSV